jgi:C4-dicarboxylate-specific signal transduction histidine kinase
MFQPFFNTHPAGQVSGPGQSLRYAILRSNGGELISERREGEGTVFIIYLPF